MTNGVSNSLPSSYTNGYANGSTATSGNDKVSKDEFLKLLTYQLKSQNPLKPYDNQEFASQLAQFSQLEQLTDIKSLIEEQVQTNTILTQTISNTALPGLLGKTAKALSDDALFNGEDSVTLGYNLPYQASSAKLVITDVSGKVVKTCELTELEKYSGDHKFKWDGTNDSGDTMPEGSYSFDIVATDKKGSAISAETFIYGEINAVRFNNDGTKLVMDGVEIPLENVMDISTEV